MDQTHGGTSIVAPDTSVRALVVPTFHAVARRVLRLLDDEAERASEIADLILADAGMTLQVLAEANRAVAPAGLRIGSVRVGLEVIGHETLRSIVTRLLSGAALGMDDRSLQLFRHSLVTSLVCESIAHVVGAADPASARTAGLLHDVGVWDPEAGHDAGGAHARHGARLLRRLGLPEEICRAVAEHHSAGDGGAERLVELVNVLAMADRVATALCVTDGDESHSADVEGGVPPRLRVLAQVAMDRAAREVSDTLSVLGTLLGIPALTLEGICSECQRLDGCEAGPPPPPAGLSADIRRGLESVRGAVSEPEAVGLFMTVVRRTPGVRTALLVLDDAGEAMLEGHPDRRPFFLRLREMTKVADGFGTFVAHVQDRGAGIYRRVSPHEGAFGLLKSESVLAVPIRVGTRNVGVVIAAEPAARVTEGAAAALGLVARATGEVLESLQLSRGSYLLAERISLDDLTGVLNRARFFERFSAEVRAANRYRRPLSLAMIDIDDFKRWNDRYGHQVGDRLLRDVSKTIRDCVRDADMVGRYGGDEFVVALPGCGGEQAEAFGSRVRERVETLGTIMRESCYEFGLSVSIGIASITAWPSEGDVLLFRADHALYHAKEKGKNRVCKDAT